MEMRRLVMIALVLGCSSSRPGSGGPDSSVDSSTIDTLGSMPDGNGCATQPCDVLTQCGCASLESCDFSDADTECRGTSGGKEGTSCGAATACASRYTCAFFGNRGNCMRYCASDADCIAPRGACAIQLVDSADKPIPGALLCTSNCDPTSVSDPLCPAGWGCTLTNASGRTVVDCLLAGAGTQGQACTDTASCAPGYTCAGPTAGPLFCRRTCAPPANTGCPAPTTCAAFTPPFVVGGTQYGICL
jgi:hypothetical protein